MATVLITPEEMFQRSGPHVDMLRDAGFEIRYPRHREFTRGLGTEDDTVEEINGACAVIAGGEYLTAGVLQRLPELRVIARMGVGYDRIDMQAASSRGVVVTITPHGNYEAVAEHTLALMFAVAKATVLTDRETRAGKWLRRSSRPLRGLTLGLLGLGRIGQSTATRARALGMHVIATELTPDLEFVRRHGIELVDLDTLLARSDHLSLHCPLNDATRGIINRETIAKMKPGSVLINTARGQLVAEADLLQALRDGHLSGAGLDVFESEPAAASNPILELQNVVVSPHIAGVDDRSIDDMGNEAAECVLKLHRGEWPNGAVVNAELQSTWKW